MTQFSTPMLLTRRCFLGSALGFATVLKAGAADATLARGLTLHELAAASGHACVATPLEAHCEWATFGNNRVIVTDTRVRVEESVWREPPGRELIVRVLGGRIGTLGEHVDGQARLVLGEPGVFFLIGSSDALQFITGAAQGHYPLKRDDQGAARLTPSPFLPTLVKPGQAAIERLRSRTVPEARELIRAAAP
jgi:hypothetical protein